MSNFDELKNKDMDAFFKAALEHYEVQPSDKVWTGIKKSLPAAKTIQPERNTGAALKTLGVALAGLTAAYLAYTSLYPQMEVQKKVQVPLGTKIFSSPAAPLQIVIPQQQNNAILPKPSLKSFHPTANALPSKVAEVPVQTPSTEAEIKNLQEQAPMPAQKDDVEGGLTPNSPATEFKLEQKLEKQKDKSDPLKLEYNDEQRDINNNILYNNTDNKEHEPKENNLHK